MSPRREPRPALPETGPMVSPGFWLHHAALAWRAEMEARLAPLGLTSTQFNLLASAGWLERGEGPPTQQQVADLAGAERTMTSKVLATLKQRGLIAHRVDPNDARTYRLTLTPEGRALAGQAAAVAQAVDAEFFGADARRLGEELRALAGERVGGRRDRAASD